MISLKEELNAWLKAHDLFDKYWKGDGKDNTLIRLNFMRDKHPEKYEQMVKKRREYTKEKNQCIKERFVELLGGKCQTCGFNEYLAALEFHHKNPKDKWSSDTYSGYQENPERFEKDIVEDKIMLLCANCHRILHANTGKMHRESFRYKEVKPMESEDK